MLAGPLIYGLSVTTIFVIVCTALLGRGFVSPRILTLGAALLVLSGLAWGAALGELLRRYGTLNENLLRRIQLGGLAMILLIAASVSLGKASYIPAYASFASEWDARHQQIIALRDAGQSHIVVAPLISAAGYAAAEDSPGDPEHHCVKYYYGVESIRESDSA